MAHFGAFLKCGILAHGFLRPRCGDCGHDKLVAFSCKRRGFCRSCGARRMAQTAAHVVDHVIPHVPVRPWVLALPIAAPAAGHATQAGDACAAGGAQAQDRLAGRHHAHRDVAAGVHAAAGGAGAQTQAAPDPLPRAATGLRGAVDWGPHGNQVTDVPSSKAAGLLRTGRLPVSAVGHEATLTTDGFEASR